MGLIEMALEPLSLPSQGSRLDNRGEDRRGDRRGSEPQGAPMSVHLPTLLFSPSQSSNTSALSSPNSFRGLVLIH